MARANRHHLPGYVWHITHRCHKREFLLKFDKDKRRWIHWLFEAKKRFGLMILNFTVTSNHIHLLVYDGKVDIIPKSIQLIAGRTGREYNQRKNRKGAFWEDRYHATAVKTGKHLIRCLAYIDLNMVRAGVVQHPGEWVYGGYQEIQNPRQRYTLINRQKLTALLGIKDNDQLSEKGELVYHSDMTTITRNMQSKKIDLAFKNTADFNFIKNIAGITYAEQINDHEFCIELCDDEKDAEQAINTLLSTVVEKQWFLTKLSPKTRSLEQIFIDFTANSDTHQPTIESSNDEKGELK